MCDEAVAGTLGGGASDVDVSKLQTIAGRRDSGDERVVVDVPQVKELYLISATTATTTAAKAPTAPPAPKAGHSVSVAFVIAASWGTIAATWGTITTGSASLPGKTPDAALSFIVSAKAFPGKASWGTGEST